MERTNVKCIDLSHDGMGVCKVDGFTYFVEGLLVGEEAIIEETSRKKNYAFAKIVELIVESKDRVKDFCPHAGVCGGCDLCHLSYKGQLEFKRAKVRTTLQKFSGVDFDVKTVLHGETDEYRNKVMVHFNDGKFGFYQKGSRDLVQIKECRISNNALIPICEAVAKINANVERLILRSSHLTNEHMVILVSKEKLTKEYELVKALLEIENVKFIYSNIHPKMDGLQMGPTTKKLYGSGEFYDEINGFKFKVSPESFFQINHEVTNKLYNQVADFGRFSKNETVVDAYCGAGTIGLTIADKIRSLIGIEVSEKAVDDAKNNANVNKISNAKFIQGKSEKEFMTIDEDLDAIIVDPPRAGCSEELLDAISIKGINKVIYVSCDVSTLGRDIKVLINKNYKLIDVIPFDMFPNTSHIETVVLLEKA